MLLIEVARGESFLSLDFKILSKLIEVAKMDIEYGDYLVFSLSVLSLLGLPLSNCLLFLS